MLKFIVPLARIILLALAAVIAGDWIFNFLGLTTDIHEPLLAFIGAVAAIIEFLIRRDKFRTDPELQQTSVPIGARTEEAYLNGRLRANQKEEERFIRLEGHYSPEVSTKTYPLQDIDDALDKFPAGFVLVGDPGAGKTTMLRHLERKAINQFFKNRLDNRFPVWINLGLVDNPVDGMALLEHWWREYPLPETPDFYRKNYNLRLLLDGLNELPLDTRKEQTTALRSLIEDSQLPIPAIITCRVDDYERDADIQQFKLPIVYIHTLNDQRIEAFIRNYGATDLWPELRKPENESSLEMARNPYKLTMLIKVFVRDGTLPTDAHQLYREYLQLTYDDYRGNRDKKRTFLLRLARQDLEGNLKELAFRMLAEGNGLSLDVDRAVRYIGNNALKDGINIGVLKREGQQIQFYHQSLQGYFAIERLGQALTLKYGWERFTKNRQALIRQIGDLGENGAPAVEPLIGLLRDNDPEVRWSAAQALGKIGDVRAVEPLIRLLGDSDTNVRSSAAPALGLLGDVRAVEPLIGLLGDSDTNVRWSVVLALGLLGDVRAVEPLIRLLGDSEPKVRLSTALALAKIGQPAVESLIGLLGDNDKLVRSSAGLALGKIGDVRSVEPLIALLEDSDTDVRLSAALVLGLLGDVRAVEWLIVLLKDSDRFVRWSAAQALGKIGDVLAVEPLTGLLHDAAEQVRKAASLALKEINQANP